MASLVSLVDRVGERRPSSLRPIGLLTQAAVRLTSPAYHTRTTDAIAEAAETLTGSIREQKKERDEEDTPLQSKIAGIDLQQLKELKNLFHRADRDGGGSLDEEEFIGMFGPILGAQMTEQELKQWFMRIDANANGAIDWDEFSTYILLENETQEIEETTNNEYAKQTTPKGVEHRGRITSLLVHPRNGRYYTAARDGAIGMWNASTMQCMELVAPRVGCWITGAAFVNDGTRLLCCSSDKSISLYDTTTLLLHKAFSAKQTTDSIVVHEEAGAGTSPTSAATAKTGTVNGGTTTPRSAIYQTNQCFDDYQQGIRAGRPVHLNLSEGPLRKVTALRIRDLVDIPQAVHVIPRQHQELTFMGLRNGQLRVYDFGKGDTTLCAKEKYSLHTDRITRLQSSVYLNCLISASWDATIKLLNLATGKVIRTLTHEVFYDSKDFRSNASKSIASFDWTESSKLLVSCGFEPYVYVWNPFITKPIYRIDNNSPATEAVFNESHNQIITVHTDKTMRVWDIRTYRSLQTIRDPVLQVDGDTISHLAFDIQRQRILTATTYPVVWPMRKALSVFPTQYPGHRQSVIQTLYNPYFHQVVSADAESIIVWDVYTGAKIVSFYPGKVAPKPCQITSIAFDDSGRRLITGTDTGLLLVWNYINGQLLKTCQSTNEEDSHIGGCEGAMYEMSCTLYVAREAQEFKSLFGSIEQTLYSWRDTDANIEKVDNVFTASNQNNILSMCFVPPHFIVLGGDNNQITLYSLFAKEECGVLGKAVSYLGIDCLLHLSGKNTIVAAGRSDGSIQLWEIVSKQLLHTFKCMAHDSSILALCTDINNDWLVVGDENGRVAVFSTKSIPKTAVLLANFKNLVSTLTSFKAHSSTITSLAYVQDHDVILSSSTDCYVKLHTLDGQLIGSFGQERRWRLGNPSSWASKSVRPCTPEKNTKVEQNELMKAYIGKDDTSADAELPPTMRHEVPTAKDAMDDTMVECKSVIDFDEVDDEDYSPLMKEKSMRLPRTLTEVDMKVARSLVQRTAHVIAAQKEKLAQEPKESEEVTNYPASAQPTTASLHTILAEADKQLKLVHKQQHIKSYENEVKAGGKHVNTVPEPKRAMPSIDAPFADTGSFTETESLPTAPSTMRTEFATTFDSPASPSKFNPNLPISSSNSPFPSHDTTDFPTLLGGEVASRTATQQPRPDQEVAPPSQPTINNTQGSLSSIIGNDSLTRLQPFAEDPILQRIMSSRSLLVHSSTLKQPDNMSSQHKVRKSRSTPPTTTTSNTTSTSVIQPLSGSSFRPSAAVVEHTPVPPPKAPSHPSRRRHSGGASNAGHSTKKRDEMEMDMRGTSLHTSLPSITKDHRSSVVTQGNNNLLENTPTPPIKGRKPGKAAHHNLRRQK